MRSYFDGMLRYFEISGRSTRLQVLGIRYQPEAAGEFHR